MVSIDVQPGTAAAYALEESTPAGWSVSLANEGGLYDQTARQVRWGPFFDNTDRQLSYRVLPTQASMYSAVAGILSVDGLDHTVAGAASLARGPDVDRDGDVDGADLDAFTRCFSGPTVQLSLPDCEQVDQDADGDVDQSDFGIFQRCYRGEGQPADPHRVQ
ncbi:MAG: hypothetical protein KA354_03760 [Phycisphaerae bacterium]|nr:hypothetical protein [Phycisphaerae bacterium]